MSNSESSRERLRAFCLLLGHTQEQVFEITCSLFSSNENRCILRPIDPDPSLSSSANLAMYSVLKLPWADEIRSARNEHWEFDLYFEGLEPDLRIGGESAGLLFVLLLAGRLYEYLTKKRIERVIAATGVIGEGAPEARVMRVDGLATKMEAVRELPDRLGNSPASAAQIQMFIPATHEPDEAAPVAAAERFDLLPVDTLAQAVALFLGAARIRELEAQAAAESKSNEATRNVGSSVATRRRGLVAAAVLVPLLLLAFAYRSALPPWGQSDGESVPPAAFPVALTVTSDRIAQVYLDGDSLGQCSTVPRTFRPLVQAGRRELKLVSASDTADCTFDAPSRQPPQINCRFIADIAISSATKDGTFQTAMIEVNGTPTNLYTPTKLRKGPGTYEISVLRSGFRTLEGNRQVSVRPRFGTNEHQLRFTLEALP